MDMFCHRLRCVKWSVTFLAFSSSFIYYPHFIMLFLTASNVIHVYSIFKIIPASFVLSFSCHGKAEECIGLCRALLIVVAWLLQGCDWYCEKLREMGPSVSTEASLRACLDRLHTLMNSTKNRALVHIARLEDQGEIWLNEYIMIYPDQSDCLVQSNLHEEKL